VNGFIFNPAVGPGTHNISYQYTAPNGCSKIASTKIEVNECLGIDRGDQNLKEILIYPNPFNKQLFISKEGVGYTLYITDGIGRMVKASSINSELTGIDVQDLPKGLYLARISEGSGAVAVFKIIKE
jgi:hypothetical protein